MEKEILVSRAKVYMETDPEGNKKFFRKSLCSDHKMEIKTEVKELFEAVESLLWPLGNLRDVLDTEEGPTPMHYLLKNMLDALELKLYRLCEAIEAECGSLDVHVSDDYVPDFTEGTILAVSRIKEGSITA
mgnify:CR=1 FL=1